MNDYNFDSKLVLRVPLLKYDDRYEKNEIKGLFTNSIIQEALYLSSPILHTKLLLWLSDKIASDKEKNRLYFSLGKYLYRMSTRCTPFGLMAGCSIVEWANQSNLKLQSTQKDRSTRLDMQYLCALIQHIESIPSIKKQLTFYPNNTIYPISDRLRYVEYFYKEKRRVHQISSVKYSLYLKMILEEATNGAKIEKLANCITDDDINFEDATDFINEIISAQLLVSELQPNVSGTSVSEVLINKLSTYSATKEVKEIIEVLQSIDEDIAYLDANQGNDIGIYKNAQQKLQQLQVSFEESKLFQTDMYYQLLQNEINGNLRKGLRNVCQLLIKLSSLQSSSNKTLEDFKKRFYARYEEQEIPLSEVLDTEMGIGFLTNSANAETPFVDDIGLSGKSNFGEIKWNHYNQLLFRIANYAFLHELQEIDLQAFEKEISLLRNKKEVHLPDTFAVMFKVIGKENGKEKLIFNHAAGTSAANLIARFANGHQPIREIAYEITKKEEALARERGEVLAEIVHLPESRTGNILFRPAFRSYEIPYLAQSTLDSSNQILLSDLMVSIQYNKVVLRSKKLNKRIVPKLSNAHNFSFNALPVYNFLCNVQNQNVRNALHFSWGSLANEYLFLPRVTYQDIILSRAQWLITKKDIDGWKDRSLRGATDWRNKRKIPALVTLAEGDNELLINFDNEFSIEIFSKEIKNKTAVILKEHLFDEENALVKDENGKSYANEFIAFLLKEKLNKDDFNNPITPIESKEIQREFIIGSKWIYFKIYCGKKIADLLISDLILPFVSYLKENKAIEKWFFIRYADPESHLRFRILLSDIDDLQNVLLRFQEKMQFYVKNKSIWKIQTDTYVREIERYGWNTMELTESMFHFDSECIANFISLIEGAEGERYRWLFSLISINSLLEDFGLDIDDKVKLMEQLKTAFGKEFGKDKFLTEQINKKYNKEKKSIELLFIENSNMYNTLLPAYELLNERSKQTVLIIKKIKLATKEKSVLMDLLGSYIHMICNRLFIDKQRKHELIVYDFLYRYYMTSFYKRSKKFD